MNEAKINILFVEDDPNTGYLLKESLVSRGYQVSLAVDGREGLRAFREQAFDLCVLDVMLPKMGGFDLALKLKAISPSVPVIFLTAKNQESDKIKGFKVGCDDYITKPFSMMELDFRIKAVLKRSGKGVQREEPVKFTFGALTFDHELRVLQSSSGHKRLTRKESDILRLLCEKRNRFVSRGFIMNHVWGSDDSFISRSMDVYMTRVRSLIRCDKSLEIVNVYGSGYMLLEKKQDNAP